jgi:hypothetical protein
MKQTQSNIFSLQRQFGAHPFFANLARGRCDLARFVPAMAFWVHTFPDVLRLNQARAQSPAIAAALLAQLKTDTNHDRWYVNDQRVLNGRELDMGDIGHARVRGVRDASYRLVLEALHASEDVERVALVEALEAAGEVFFDCTGQVLADHPHTEQLKYFIGIHTVLEQGHADEMTVLMSERYTSGRDVALANAMRERVFGHFGVMFDTLDAVSAVAEAA